MPRIIKLSDADKNDLHQYLDEIILKLHLCPDKISFTRVLTSREKHRATLTFTPLAWSKMSYILMKNSAEVAWHGLVRKKVTEPFSYEVYDILIYPQKVSGVTVDTDQVLYQNWTTTLTDAQFNDLRMQAHSHVLMGVTPSGRDESDQERLLESMPSSIPFYIFMIWNKKMEYHCRIYDMESNILFETNDVDLKLCDDSGFDSDEFCAEITRLVTRQVYTPQTTGVQNNTIAVAAKPSSTPTVFNPPAQATATNAVKPAAGTSEKPQKKKKMTVASLNSQKSGDKTSHNSNNSSEKKVYDCNTNYNYYGGKGNGEDPYGPFGWYEQ